MTTLQLVYTQDNQAVPSDTLDLLCFTGEVGFQLANNGWVPIIGRGRMQESLTLHAKGDDQDEVIAYLESLLKKWENYVIWSQDFTQERSVWLQVQWEDETNIRQARLTSFNFQINSSPFGEFWQNSNFTEATLTFERLEWEVVTSPGSFFVPDGLSALGVTRRINGAGSPDKLLPYGDINARALQMQIQRTLAFDPTTIWMGFRRNRTLDPFSFVPRWECEYGTAISADTTITADVTASNSSRMTTDFSAITTLTQRFSVSLSSILSHAGKTGFESSQRGKFLVLLRAKLSAAGAVNARLTYGSGGLNILARVPIAGTAWKFYEMGIISIPPQRVPLLVDTLENMLLSNFAIVIDAEKISGAGGMTFSCDCLVLIPIDEAYLKVSQNGLARAGTDFFIFQNDLGDVSGYAGTETTMDAMLETDQYNWGIPPRISSDGNFIVFACEPSSVSNVTGFMSIHYLPRWQLARGTE